MHERVKIIRRDVAPHLPWQSFAIEDPLGDSVGESLRALAEHVVRAELDSTQIADLTRELHTLTEAFEQASPQRVRERIMGPEKTDEDVYRYIAFNPIRGSMNPLAAPLRVWAEGDGVRGEVRFGSAYEGPPGHVHGGHVAALFDDFLACVQALSGTRGFTGTLEIRFRAPTPLHTNLRLEGRFDQKEGRKILTRGAIFANEVLTAEALGTFIAPTPEHIEKLRRSMQENAKP